jgi:hypothetical protein
MRRPWIVLAIVATLTEYVIWRLDTETPRRPGDGWQVAARVPPDNVLQVDHFVPQRDGRQSTTGRGPAGPLVPRARRPRFPRESGCEREPDMGRVEGLAR